MLQVVLVTLVTTFGEVRRSAFRVDKVGGDRNIESQKQSANTV